MENDNIIEPFWTFAHGYPAKSAKLLRSTGSVVRKKSPTVAPRAASPTHQQALEDMATDYSW